MGGNLAFYAVLAAALFGVVLLASWLQSRSYRGYLEKVAAENEKLVASQRQTQVLLERQTVALDRIAVALERRIGS